ncbi:MAG: hypothetical protein V4553_07320 [Bacteroidota bacterium]
MITTIESADWSTLQKIGFRFFFVFFVLYVILEPNGIVPFSDDLSESYLHPLVIAVPWMAKHWLHISITVNSYGSGSGDRTFDWLIYGSVVIIATFSCAIWSLVGRKARNYNKMLYWLCTIIRYYAGMTMLRYGGAKVIKLQFAGPNPMRLMEPVGELSPFSLAWTYMGHSVAFNYFAGLAEVACGMLMFWRRTTTLGAVMGFVIAGNIVAINYCFDVPVKLLSTTLTIMFAFLLATDSRRLINVFITNKTALPANYSPHRFNVQWKNVTLTTTKYIVIGFVLLANIYNFTSAGKMYGDDSKKPQLYGIYNVQYFIINNDTLQPLITDTVRWRKLMFDKFNNGAVKMMNDSLKYYVIKQDSVKHTLKINTFADTAHKMLFSYRIIKRDTLILKGSWKKDSLKVKLIRYDYKNFTLLNRGFHFVNESVYSK